MTENTKISNEIIIRQYKMDDYDGLIALWVASGLPFKPCGRDRREEIEKQIQFPNVNYMVAEIEGKIAGSVFATHDGRKGWINRIAVHPDYRNKGLAITLTKKAEDWLSGLGIDVLCCLIEDWNDKSMNLAQKLGYKKLPEIIYFAKKKFPGA